MVRYPGLDAGPWLTRLEPPGTRSFPRRSSALTAVKGWATVRSGERVELASPIARLGARVIDTVLMLVVAIVVTTAIRGLVDGDDTSLGFASRNMYVVLAALGLLYEIPMVAKNGGQTLGKVLTRVRIVRKADGGMPRWRDSVVRWIIPAVPGTIPLIGPLLWLLVYTSLTFDDARQGWHDGPAGTLVVKRRQSTSAREQSQAVLSEMVTAPVAVDRESGSQEASDTSGRESASRPDDKDGDDSSQKSGNAAAVSGFVFSVIAVIPPAFFAYHLATVPSSTFREARGFGSFAYGLGLVLFLVPFEAIFGLLATILSIKGIVRAKTEKRPRMVFGIAGLVISLVALVLTISAFVLLDVRGSYCEGTGCS